MCLLMAGCSLFPKNITSNEVEALTKDVLEAKQGVEIEIKPIEKVK